MSDFRKLKKEQPVGVYASPTQDDIMAWHAVIIGPEGTAWAGGTFRLALKFNEEYPAKPPNVKFITKMFHPNSTSSSVSKARTHGETRRCSMCVYTDACALCAYAVFFTCMFISLPM